MKCSNCNHNYPESNAYCTNCGENNPQYTFNELNETNEIQSERYSNTNEVNEYEINSRQESSYVNKIDDKANPALNVLCFLIPIVGLIIAASGWSKKPKASSSYLSSAGWGFLFDVFLFFIL